MRTTVALLGMVLVACSWSVAQQKNPPAERVRKTNPQQSAAAPAPNPEQAPAAVPQQKAQPHPEHPAAEEPDEEHPPRPGSTLSASNPQYDMAEVAPIVTHHQAQVGGKLLRYTATAGRLPIKNSVGKIEAEMFFVAYTLDNAGADPATRPLTFSFNGGPGSASIWLHMGVMGPKRVSMLPDGSMPPAPYRLVDNESSPLDKTDIVMIDAIGTGYSRPENNQVGKKFWSVKGDVESFGEFIRMYLSRYERWSSPLYLLGESYGTTRSAGVAGYLNDKGISFNGVMLLSTVLYFQTLEFSKQNDVPYPLILPSYTMIAAYHKKLAPDLMQDMAKTRAQVEQFASGEYTEALAKGDAISPQQRQDVIDKLARFTGLTKLIIDQADLRIDVSVFTHNLYGAEKERVGRLDGRYVGPDPNGYNETRFFDPSSAATTPPFFTTFNNYIRTELNYKTDMPYNTSADRSGGFEWNWGSAGEGYADTASALRSAMVQNPWLKVMVLEGYYDLATPYYAADYTFDHMDLPERFRKNISKATYPSGHMVYMEENSRHKMHDDVDRFIEGTLNRGR